MNEIVHLNLEWMKLGDKALDLCEGLVRNTSLHAIHLSNNLIGKETQGKMKWFLSVGVDIQNKAFLDHYFPDEEEGGAEPGPASEPKTEEDNAGSKLSKQSLTKVPEEKASTRAVVPRPIAANPYADDHVELTAADLIKPVDEAELKLRLDKETQPAPLSSTRGAKGIFNGPATFELNVVNQGTLKEFNTRARQLVNYLPAQSKLERLADIAGGVFILARLVGHPELEPLQAPLYSQERVQQSKDDLALEEKQKREIEMYGGVIGPDGSIQQPPDLSKEASQTSFDSGADGALASTGRLMESMLSVDAARGLRRLKYEAKSTNMKWSAGGSCWCCE